MSAGLQPYSVCGCWAETRERFAEVYRATSARAAEDLAQLDAADKGGTLWVCRVVPGEIAPADRYTAFVDPADPRNTGRDDLEADMPALDGDPEWTVFGIAVPAGCHGSVVGWTGERYGDVINATSAGAAEDVARSRLADKDGELWVCTVLAGRVAAADTYATFVDPDVKTRQPG
jgi:hypothetical protein